MKRAHIKYALFLSSLSFLAYAAVSGNIRTQEQNNLVEQQAVMLEECVTANVNQYCPSLFKYTAALEDENSKLNKIIYSANKKLIECENEGYSEE